MKKKNLIPIFFFIFALNALLMAQENDEESVNIDIPAVEQKSGSDSKQNNAEQGSNESSDKSYQFRGKLNSWLGAGTQGDNNYKFNYNRVKLELTEVYKNITFYINASGRYNSVYENQRGDNYRRGESLKFDLTEAYINYELLPGSFLKQWNFYLGQQIVNWGKADEVRPTDIVSPQDMTLMVLEDRNERKMGRFAFKSLMNFGETFRFEAIFLPVHRYTEGTMDQESAFSPYAIVQWEKAGNGIGAPLKPEEKFSNTDVALKAYLQLFTIDFAFSFYNGYDPMPVMKVSGTNLIPFLTRVTMWGFDFEKAIWGVGFRGEAAYFSKGKMFNYDPSQSLSAKYGSEGVVRKDYLDVTAGFDISNFLFENFYINLQYNMNHIRDYEDGLQSNYMMRVGQTDHKGIWSLSYEFGGLKYKIEFAGNYNFSNDGYLLKPSFSAKIGPETKIIIGAYFFGGDRNTELGQFQDQDFGYLKLEHLF